MPLFFIRSTCPYILQPFGRLFIFIACLESHLGLQVSLYLVNDYGDDDYKALMIFCQNSVTPHMVMPSLMTPITNAPTIVPPMVPTPPAIEVPPRTDAAMAFISQDSPVLGVADTKFGR